MKEILKNKKIRLFVFMYFIFLSLYFSIYTFSKYSGRVNGNGELSVAKWDISLASENNSISLMGGGSSVNYNLNVTSNSDVGIDYYVTISNIPNGVILTVDGRDPITINGDVDLGKVGTIYANDETKTKTHVLNFKAPLGIGEVSNKDILVNVKFIQTN